MGVISTEVEEGETLNVTEDLAISDTENADSGEGVDESELIDLNDISGLSTSRRKCLCKPTVLRMNLKI